MQEVRGHFSGSVEVEVDGDRYGAHAELKSYVDVTEVKMIGANSTIDGPTSWDGWISDLQGTSLPIIFGKRRVTLIFPDGGSRVIALKNLQGSIDGTGKLPF
jgi:hypothetical protein